MPVLTIVQYRKYTRQIRFSRFQRSKSLRSYTRLTVAELIRISRNETEYIQVLCKMKQWQHYCSTTIIQTTFFGQTSDGAACAARECSSERLLHPLRQWQAAKDGAYHSITRLS